MEYSRLFGKIIDSTAVPSDRLTAQDLLERGGFIRSFGGGLYALLPSGLRVYEKIIGIIRREMEGLGGQEFQVPFVLPLTLWKKTGRHEIVADELVQMKDRTGRDILLASSHLEAVTELMRLGAQSTEDLPMFLFQFQGKFRDEKNTHAGILRAKEFLMNDAYSFHRSFTDLNTFFPKVFAAYERIFSRCGIDYITAESAVGSISGDKAYEFLLATDIGEDQVVRCPRCGYAANQEVGLGVKTYHYDPPKPLNKITVSSEFPLERYMDDQGIPEDLIIQTKLYRIYGGFVLVSILQGYEISTEKLSRFLNTAVIREASRAEYNSYGLKPNYLGPVGLESALRIVVDDAVARSDNLLAGANRRNSYFINVNFGRDFESPLVGDIVRSRRGNRCKICRSELDFIRVIELGNIFKIGDFFSRSLHFSLRDGEGRDFYPHMGAYGIGIGRLMAAVVHAHHDDRGIVWPPGLEPYTFYLTGSGKSIRMRKILERIYGECSSECLFDDMFTGESRGFAVADLLGIPWRLTVSVESLEKGGLYLSSRNKEDRRFIDIDKVPGEMAALIGKAVGS